MNYYSHHIGDYRRDTAHLSLLEHGVYRQLLDMYYLSEEPIPEETEVVFRRLCARTEEEKKAVITILKEFFKMENGWSHKRCEEQIHEYQSKAERARTNGKLGGRPSKTKEVIFDNQETSEEKANHKPITNNHKPIKSIEADASATSDKKPSEDGLFGSQPESQLKCPVGHIVDSYHAAMPMNPQVKVLNDARKKTIAARWREASRMTVAPFGYKTVAEGLIAWKAFFEVCNESRFLTGQAKAQPGKPPFIADIDFLMSPSGFASTLENKYHRDAE